MAITIETYSISNDLSKIDLKLEMDTGDYITKALLWTEKTYKNPSQSIDLLSFMNGSLNTENVTINATSLSGISLFNGIYFIELESQDNHAVLIAASDFTQYYKIAAQLLANLNMSCLSCNSDFQNALLLDLYTQATINSLLLGRYQDAIEHLAKIVIVKSNYAECEDCNQIEASVSSAGNIVSVGIIDCQITT